MLKLIIGILIGIVLGVFAMAMVSVSSSADQRMETMMQKHEEDMTTDDH